MKINLFKLLLFIVLPFYLSAQQTVRGIITDKDSKETIPFANILIKNVTPLLGTISDENGKFILKNVPIGKQTLIVTFLGYETITLSNLNVTSGKEVVLNIGLIEDFEKLDEVIVVGGRKKEETVNEFSSVSARSLNIEDANLYAASFGDPARQVQNFAGVTGNGDDLNNEIVIRGNSPNTVLWRLEGAEIPNPNHFVYSTGGAVSMLSSNVLDKTDFFTSAFPAEYGNAKPIASDTHAIVFAVNWPPQAPALGQATNSNFLSSAADIWPDECFPTASNTSTTVTSLPLYLPGRIDPPYINTLGTFNLTIDIINAGKDLSQPAIPTKAS